MIRSLLYEIKEQHAAAIEAAVRVVALIHELPIQTQPMTWVRSYDKSTSPPENHVQKKVDVLFHIHHGAQNPLLVTVTLVAYLDPDWKLMTFLPVRALGYLPSDSGSQPRFVFEYRFERSGTVLKVEYLDGYPYSQVQA